MAPENGSLGQPAGQRPDPRRDETPALTGIPVARPEGLEPPTF